MGLRVTLKPQQGNSGFLSSCDGDLKGPLELLHVNQTSSRVETGNLGLFYSRSGKLGFLSSGAGDLRVPVELPQGSRPPLMVRGGTWSAS